MDSIATNNPPATPIVEYSKTDAALAELAQRYAGVLYPVTTKEGMEQAKAGRSELRTLRLDIEATREALKKPIIERGRLVDGEAKRITAALVALENPIDAQIKAEEKRVNDERMKLLREAEERRLAEEKAAREAEERKLREQREELERREAAIAAEEKARKDKIEAEDRQRRERIEAEERDRKARIEAEERERRERIEAEDRARREEQDRLNAAKKAEQDRIDEANRVERERIEAERKAAEELKRKTEAEAAERQRELDRQAVEQADALSMLQTFVDRFGQLRQFKEIAKAITKFIGEQK